MSAIDYSLNNIFNRIPVELLERAFPQNTYYGYSDNRTLEERIKVEVIDQMVMKDADVVGGQQITFNIGNINPKRVETGVIYEIPLSMTQGRKISTVISIDFGNDTGSGTSNPGGSKLSLLMDRVVNSAEGPRGSSTANIKLIGPNVVWCGDNTRSLNTSLRCRLVNDEYMSNLTSRGNKIFSDMVVLAAKGIIYKKLRISMGEGSLTGGSLNGMMSSMLDEYADSFDLYDELMRGKWRKESIMSDETTMREMNRLSIRPY